MLNTITSFDVKTLGTILIGISFAIWGLHLTPNNGTLSNKYKRFDYIGVLICLFFAGIAHILKILQISDIQSFVGFLSLWDFILLLFLCIWFLRSGFINIRYKKEINDDTSYKFGVSTFISGWVLVLFLLVEFFG